MERYEAYKDSGVEWIGEIPEHIDFVRTHYNLELTKGRLPAATNRDGYGIPYIGATDLDSGGECSTYTTDYDLPLAELDDLLVLWDGARAGISGTGRSGAISSTIVRVRTNIAINRRFFSWYYKAFEPYILDQVNGTTIPHMNRVYFDDIGFLNWSYSDQQAIADYLDEKTDKIDGLVADCEREVGLLQEYRKAVISEAVTKGLDPDAPMKDSGIEWIGEIPADWEIRRIKSFLRLRDERNSLPLEEVNLISLYTDLGVVQHADLEKTTGNKAMTADGYKLVYENDIVVNIILCWMGAIGMSNYYGVTSPAYDVYIPNDEVDPRYLHYLFRTSAFGGECYKAGRGIMAMRWRTYSDQFKSITVPFPPLKEQVAIAKRLDAKTAEIDALIKAKQTMADKLREYRKSLISEAVTGKFKVPGV